MKLFQKKKIPRADPELFQAEREVDVPLNLPLLAEPFEKELFDRLRYAVPIIDAAIMKIIRLTGGFRLVSSDEQFQEQLERFCINVPVGLQSKSIGCFSDTFLDNLLTYGSAVGEIVIDEQQQCIAGLWNGNISDTVITSGSAPFERQYAVRNMDGSLKKISHPERILFSSLTGGYSLLREIGRASVGKECSVGCWCSFKNISVYRSEF